jgi:aminoglycoside/choline kinase family phosphotransferase
LDFKSSYTSVSAQGSGYYGRNQCNALKAWLFSSFFGNAAGLSAYKGEAEVSEEQEQLSWLAEILECDATDVALQLVAGDASPRKFYRVFGPAPGSRMLMVSPPTENNERFVLIQRTLEGAGVRVPSMARANLALGYFLLEDLGDSTFSLALEQMDVDGLYKEALDTLALICAIRTVAPELPHYSEKELQRELDVCPEWFFSKALSLQSDNEALSVFAELSACVIGTARHQPQGLVHRDYHSRNLMVPDTDTPLAVIDFQDAIMGPVTYDAASLLKDVYVVWPRERQLVWLNYYWKRLVHEGQLDQGSWPQFIEWYDLIGLQRHVKILGVFSRLWLRDDKPSYMRDIPVVIEYIRESCHLYRETHPAIGMFWDWFDESVMPTVERQKWYSAS